MENAVKVWLNPQELFKKYGISISTQNKMRMKRQIPFSKIGRKIFYDEQKISKWIEDAEVC